MQEKGKDFFAMLAERDHTTVEKVKEKISKRIWEGLHDPDPERRAQWERIPCAGDVPTPEEWLRYSVERLRDDGREDLLLSIPWLQSHSIRYREPSIPNDRAT